MGIGLIVTLVIAAQTGGQCLGTDRCAVEAAL